MSPLARHSLIAAVVGALLVGGAHLHLQHRLIPRMQVAGNASLLRAMALATSRFTADFRTWPSGTPEEILGQLVGQPEAIQAKARGEEDSKVTRMRDALPYLNYLRDLPTRVETLYPGDAWKTPMKFESDDERTRITSAGLDGRFGTADDMAEEARFLPADMHPRRADYEQAMEVRRFRQWIEARRRQR